MEITWIHVATESLLFCYFHLIETLEIAMWVALAMLTKLFSIQNLILHKKSFEIFNFSHRGEKN